MTPFRPRHRRSSDTQTPRNRHGGLDLGAAALTLGFGAFAHAVLPERARDTVGAGAAVGLAALAHTLGADARDLGVDRRDLGSGLRVGAAAASAVVAATALARALDRGGTAFRDARVTDASNAQAAVHLLVRIPLATALIEELVFRGVILGLGARTADRRRALLVSSAAFGLWHIGAALHPAAPRRGRRCGGSPGNDGARGAGRRPRDDGRRSRLRVAAPAFGQHPGADARARGVERERLPGDAARSRPGH